MLTTDQVGNSKLSTVLLSGDLIFSSRASGAAARCDSQLVTVASAEAACQACASGEVSLVLVDLTMRGLDVRALVDQLRAASPGKVAIVAYGPHVQEAALGAAREAGCDEVLSRGQVDREIDAILARFRE